MMKQKDILVAVFVLSAGICATWSSDLKARISDAKDEQVAAGLSLINENTVMSGDTVRYGVYSNYLASFCRTCSPGQACESKCNEFSSAANRLADVVNQEEPKKVQNQVSRLDNANNIYTKIRDDLRFRIEILDTLFHVLSFLAIILTLSSSEVLILRISSFRK
jgi:hypothetical protein